MKDYSEVTVEMINHYNRPGPRYTSYPTVPTWESGAFQNDYADFLKREGERDMPLSLYVHIPFCSRLCTYCGCNQFITRNNDLVENYLDVLRNELQQTALHLGKRKLVKQLHLGGGTPTHLSVEQLRKLYRMIAEHFDFDPEGEMALEAHPRVTREDQLEALYELGFRRISLGVQDLDMKVQRAINRDQTLEQTSNTFSAARKIGYSSINVDLVYGLPCQTVKTFQSTMETIDAMNPDRLAIYSFAYIPNMFQTHERAIKEADLPSSEEKVATYIASIRFFTQAGYHMIGMDHYAKASDELALAQKNKTLHRNFMGYTTLRGLSQIGVGVSAISDFGEGYFQNEKSLDAYMSGVQEGHVPTIRMKALDADDRLRREVIETLMCQCSLSLPAIEEKYELEFKKYFAPEWEAMQTFEEEGLVELFSDRLNLTKLGTLFMRNVAMPFDRYLKQQSRPHFSKTV
ncbi:MAG: oxygen-independent coproporphyrinogen III oxidase [SAR324 cluster bacterium]|nr:oxygen-independent coproporphyrinogen III oxidase [SAR324 cluster bacterium]